MQLTEATRLDLVEPSDKPGEWWVTLDGKAVIGFSGHNAHGRAEQQFHELLRIARSRSPRAGGQ